MGDELESSCKGRTSRTNSISTKNPRTPSTPFVSPVIRRCEHEDKEQNKRAKKTRLEDNYKEGRTCLFQEQDERMQIHSSVTGNGDDLKAVYSDASDDHEPSTSTSQNDVELKKLHWILKDKQETLRKLNLVRMYRKKNDLQTLQGLINKWRRVSQEGATSLLNSISEGDTPNMSQLLHELQINQQLIHYSIENETFW